MAQRGKTDGYQPHSRIIQNQLPCLRTNKLQSFTHNLQSITNSL